MLEICDAHPGRFLVAGGIGDPSRPGRQVARIRELAQHPRFAHGARDAARVAGADQRRAPLSRLPGVRGAAACRSAINAGIPGPRVRSQGAAPRAARGRADRLPRPRRDRRAHGPPVRGAAHELHAQVVEPLPVVHRVRAAVHGPEPREVHEHEDVPRPRALGQRRAVVPDAPLARRSARRSRSTTRRCRCSSAAPPAACSRAPSPAAPAGVAG